MSVARLAASFRRWSVGSEGSTRPVALMRIAVVAIIWARWANDFVLFRHLTDGHFTFAIAFFIVTTLAFVGLFTRASMALTAACTGYMVFYMGHYQHHGPYTHHHTTLLFWASLLLSLTPCGRSYSVDRYRAVVKAESEGRPSPPERGNLWGQRLLMLQVSAIYAWATIDKLNLGFLSGARMQHYLMFFYTGSTPLSEFPGLPVLTTALAWSTTLLEGALAIGLWFRASRRWLFIPGLLLHGVFYMGLSVFTYSATMWALYLAFVDPDGLHALIDRISGHGPSTSEGKATASGRIA